MTYILTDFSARKYKTELNKKIEKVCGGNFHQEIIMRLKSVLLYLLMDLSASYDAFESKRRKAFTWIIDMDT
jgi:hypothetical protein